MKFAAIYRWRVKPGHEEACRESWRKLTVAIQKKFRTGGSRLHRADDGSFVAYAIWPDRETYDASRTAPSADADAASAFRDTIDGAVETTKVDVLDDLWAR